MPNPSACAQGCSLKLDFVQSVQTACYVSTLDHGRHHECRFCARPLPFLTRGHLLHILFLSSRDFGFIEIDSASRLGYPTRAPGKTKDLQAIFAKPDKRGGRRKANLLSARLAKSPRRAARSQASERHCGIACNVLLPRIGSDASFSLCPFGCRLHSLSPRKRRHAFDMCFGSRQSEPFGSGRRESQLNGALEF